MALVGVQDRLVPEQNALSAELHPVLRRILLARGVRSDKEAALGLGSLLRPEALLNIEAAVALLAEEMQAGGRILVVGDFDADGATSSALSVLCLRAMGHDAVDYLVPNRFEYGYGLSPEIVDVAAERQPDLIMTVDNGVASHEGVKAAQARGIKVLVTDHHLPGDHLPPAEAILNPNLPDCGFPSKALAGVGVVFYLMMALRASLRKAGWFAVPGRAEPNLAQFMDIVALGTVADVVPLDHNNRCLVDHGLKVIRSGLGRPGIRALLEVAGRSVEQVQAADLGFAAGPRLNAAGRLDDISVGIECLLTEDALQAMRLAGQLDAYNRDRRNIEQAMQQEALDDLEDIVGEQGLKAKGLCVFRPEWHQGVIGILASRLKERFHRPVIAFAEAGLDARGQAQIKGSARSIPGLHMRDLLDLVAKRHPELLSKYGGHAMAAGLSLRRDDFDAFHAAWLAVLDQEVEESLLSEVHYCDGELPSDCLSLDFAQLLLRAGPWGQAFPEPSFRGEFRVLQRRVLKDRHLKLVLSPLESPGLVLDAIAFNVEPSWLSEAAEYVALHYSLQVNSFRGRESAQLMVHQLARR